MTDIKGSRSWSRWIDRYNGLLGNCICFKEDLWDWCKYTFHIICSSNCTKFTQDGLVFNMVRNVFLRFYISYLHFVIIFAARTWFGISAIWKGANGCALSFRFHVFSPTLGNGKRSLMTYSNNEMAYLCPHSLKQINLISIQSGSKWVNPSSYNCAVWLLIYTRNWLDVKLRNFYGKEIKLSVVFTYAIGISIQEK